MRAKKKCRFHLKDDDRSIEGILANKTKTEYIVWCPKVITGDRAKPEIELTGHVEIPISNVLFYQVIG